MPNPAWVGRLNRLKIPFSRGGVGFSATLTEPCPEKRALFYTRRALMYQGYT
jgi:hypothetical protein